MSNDKRKETPQVELPEELLKDAEALKEKVAQLEERLNHDLHITKK